jgi:hypothetical protein
MASPSFVDDSQEALELGAILSTNIATLITTNQKKERTLLLKKIANFASHFFMFHKTL